MEFPQILKTELPEDPVIPLLGIHPEEIKSLSCRDIYTSIFITALIIIAKTWKQPECPSIIAEWIKKMWYVYTVEQHGWT